MVYSLTQMDVPGFLDVKGRGGGGGHWTRKEKRSTSKYPTFVPHALALGTDVGGKGGMQKSGATEEGGREVKGRRQRPLGLEACSILRIVSQHHNLGHRMPGGKRVGRGGGKRASSQKRGQRKRAPFKTKIYQAGGPEKTWSTFNRVLHGTQKEKGELRGGVLGGGHRA